MDSPWMQNSEPFRQEKYTYTGQLRRILISSRCIRFSMIRTAPMLSWTISMKEISLPILPRAVDMQVMMLSSRVSSSKSWMPRNIATILGYTIGISSLRISQSPTLVTLFPQQTLDWPHGTQYLTITDAGLHFICLQVGATRSLMYSFIFRLLTRPIARMSTVGFTIPICSCRRLVSWGNLGQPCIWKKSMETSFKG